MKKLVLAIVRDMDASGLTSALNQEGYSVTKLASTGGFLRVGNVTLLIGVDQEQVESVLEIIRTSCVRRKKTVIPPATFGGIEGGVVPFPVEVDIGGATVFVLDVDQFEQI